MLELLSAFSVQQILLFTIMISLSIKGLVDFFQWGKGLYQKKFDKDHSQLSKQEELEQHYKNCREQHQESMQLYTTVEQKIDILTDTVNDKINYLEKAIDQLTVSDMHDIKGWIVEKHHKLIEQGWVDDFTMDTLEKRFSDYKKEGGNSYVEGLMNELRALPHIPK